MGPAASVSAGVAVFIPVFRSQLMHFHKYTVKFSFRLLLVAANFFRCIAANKIVQIRKFAPCTGQHAILLLQPVQFSTILDITDFIPLPPYAINIYSFSIFTYWPLLYLLFLNIWFKYVNVFYGSVKNRR